MSTSTVDSGSVRALVVRLDDDTLSVDLADGRTISVPLGWFPRLVHGSQAEREHWRLIGQGTGIHWSDLDEDVSIRNLIDGKSSGESQESFRRWLASRASEPTV